jgi:hypothetical protein
VAMGKAPERRAVSVAPPGRATATRDKRQARPKSETGRLSVTGRTWRKGGHFFPMRKARVVAAGSQTTPRFTASP